MDSYDFDRELVELFRQLARETNHEYSQPQINTLARVVSELQEEVQKLRKELYEVSAVANCKGWCQHD